MRYFLYGEKEPSLINDLQKYPRAAREVALYGRFALAHNLAEALHAETNAANKNFNVKFDSDNIYSKSEFKY